MLSKKILIPLAVVLLAAPTVFADSGNRTAGDRKLHGVGMLNLTGEQKTELREMMKTQREVLKGSLLALRASGIRLRIAFQSSDSEEEIRIQAAALSALKVQIDAAKLDHQIAVWRILTPDQRLLMTQQRHRGFRDRKWGKGWGRKHSMNWKKSGADKWDKSRKDSDSKREY
jgi:Spy/CpxP family protein refolding chaperone